jgi:hypothetical protein
VPLTKEQRDQAAALAMELGESAEDLIAELEELAAKESAGDRAEPASTKAGAPTGEVKIFAYHLPFLQAGEVRKSIGFEPGGIPEPTLPSGQWLQKYGGGESAPSEGQETGSTGGEKPRQEE